MKPPAYEVLHEVQTITIRLFDCNGEMIFVSDEIHAKNAPETKF